MSNEDPFHKHYNPINKNQQALIADINDAASELFDSVNRVDNEYDARCGYLAKTRIEEAVMWAVKGVTRNPSKGNA